jgi:hypothetical protein
MKIRLPLGALGAAIAKAVGAREVLLFAGLGLFAVGAAQIYAPAAWAIPGAVLVYVAIAGLR